MSDPNVEKDLETFCNGDTCTVSKQFLRSLLLSSFKLQALENGGVDNWSWYSDSLREEGYFKYAGLDLDE